MQLTNILLSLAAVVGVINAAPAPLPAANVAKIFNRSSCMTVTYDTPQGIAFYKIGSADADSFGEHCKTCIEATMGCGDEQCKESKFAECAKKYQS